MMWGWILIVAVAIAVCMPMMAHMMRHRGPGPVGPGDDRDEDAPERILARRLASGEIDVKEFTRLRDALHPASAAPADAAEPSGAGRNPPKPGQDAF